MCMFSPFRGFLLSLQLKNFLKNIYKKKCRVDEIDTIFNSPCLLAYFECFNTIEIAHACSQRML